MRTPEPELVGAYLAWLVLFLALYGLVAWQRVAWELLWARLALPGATVGGWA